LLNNLKAEWEGEAMKGYEERYRKIKSTAFKSVKELFEEISHNLTKSAEIVEKADAEIGRQYRG
jgi:WXG100 family type VII secretion target